MKKVLGSIAGIGLLSVGLIGSAAAADGAQLFTSKGCIACHGADAKTPIMPTYPKLAGQNPQYAYQQMLDIKSGKRANGQAAAMKAIVAGVSDADLKAISEWLGTLK